MSFKDSLGLGFPIRDNMWQGERCFLIGGGASLVGFDFSKLEGERTIGINRVCELFEPDILLMADVRLIKWAISTCEFGQEGRAAFDSQPRKILVGSTEDGQAPGGVRSIREFNPNGAGDGSYLSPSLYEGLALKGNTGIAALNLALCLGATTIYLLGFDGDNTHFHDGYPIPSVESAPANFRSSFSNVATEARKRAKIVNLSPTSKIDAFDFEKFEDVGRPILPPIAFHGFQGFGDNIYCLGVMRALCKLHECVYLSTPIPEIFWDIPNLFTTRPKMLLRTQTEHAEKQPEVTWSNIPHDAQVRRMDHYLQDERRTVLDVLATPLEKGASLDVHLAIRREWEEAARAVLEPTDKKVCLIRCPTERTEWDQGARNPEPHHIQNIVDRFGDQFHFVSVSHNKTGEEWFLQEPRGIDQAFHFGELPLTTIFGLASIADMIVSPPGYMLPLGLAVETKTFIVFGGLIPPWRLVDERQNMHLFRCAAPDPFDGSNKYMPDEKVTETFGKFIDADGFDRSTILVAAGIGDIHWAATKFEGYKKVHGIECLTVETFADSRHAYSLEFLEMIECVDVVRRRSRPNPMLLGGAPIKNEALTGGTIFEMNTALEQGNNIQDVLPEYGTNFDYEVAIKPEDRIQAKRFKEQQGGVLNLIYTSGDVTNNAWKGWTPERWYRYATMVHQRAGTPVVLLGAAHDSDLGLKIAELDAGNGVVRNLVGDTTVSQVLSYIEAADSFVSFPSGLAILATKLKTPVFMFWPRGRWTPAFRTDWVDPAFLESNRYFHADFGTVEAEPEVVFAAMKRFIKEAVPA